MLILKLLELVVTVVVGLIPMFLVDVSYDNYKKNQKGVIKNGNDKR